MAGGWLERGFPMRIIRRLRVRKKRLIIVLAF